MEGSGIRAYSNHQYTLGFLFSVFHFLALVIIRTLIRVVKDVVQAKTTLIYSWLILLVLDMSSKQENVHMKF